jgi:hypothetical protein
MKGMWLDMIPCAFLVATLFVLAKLFKQCELCIFFSRQNVCYLRWVAGLLIAQVTIHPFYLILKNFNFDSISQVYPLALLSLNDFKIWVIIFSLFLLAYIVEVGFCLEEEVNCII